VEQYPTTSVVIEQAECKKEGLNTTLYTHVPMCIIDGFTIFWLYLLTIPVPSYSMMFNTVFQLEKGYFLSCVILGGDAPSFPAATILFLCPFAVYYLRYATTSFFTMSRIPLADGKRAGQKVQRKIAVAVQNVKPLYFLSLSFEIMYGKRK
jgi:hypothetical protein